MLSMQAAHRGQWRGTQYVDAKEAARSVIAEYGAERVAWVLAGHVNASDWDGRLSRDSKEWAKDFDVPDTDVHHLRSHQTIIESFVTRFREIEREAELETPTLTAVTAENETAEPQTPVLQGNLTWQEYQALAAEHRDKILFTQVGDNYAVFGSDAVAVARFLDIYQSSSDVGLPERVPMCGVPNFRLDEYTDKLTSNGFGVVIRNFDGTLDVRESTKPELTSTVYHSPENNIAYREGDIFGQYATKAVILEITDSYVHYNFINNPQPEPFRIARERFEELLDNGVNTIQTPEPLTHTLEKTQEILYGLVEKARSGHLYYADAENAALELNLSLAEYGDQNPANHFGADAYAFWNADGNRYADSVIRVDYNFNEDGKAGKAENIEIDFTAFGIEPPHPTLFEQEIETRFQAVTEADVSEAATHSANFRITDPHLGEGGAKTKYAYNIEAIKTLQAVESENRSATPDEQEILSRFVGWGGLQEAFDESKTGWAREYQELKGLLSPDEYDAARASVLNAHYTSPTVISAMYEALERMGVNGGNILEPSCGVGNFLGLLPDSMQNAKLYGVELDSITGRIAQQLYPQADIKVTGFEKTTMPDSFFDVAVGTCRSAGLVSLTKSTTNTNL